MTPLPKHLQVRQGVLNLIAHRNLGTGAKLPNEQRLSQTFGVSLITMRRALADLQDCGVLQRVHGKGTFVRATQFRDAPALGTVAFLLVANGQESCEKLAGDVRQALATRRHRLEWIVTADQPDRFVTDSLSGVSGVLLTGAVSDGWLELLRTMAIPFAVIGTYDLPPAVWRAAYDWAAATRLLVQRFAETGFRRIGLINSARGSAQAREIHEAYTSTLAELGLQYAPERVLWAGPGERDTGIRAFYEANPQSFDGLVVEGDSLDTALSFLYSESAHRPVLGCICADPRLERSLPKVLEVGFEANLAARAVDVLFGAMSDTRSSPQCVKVPPILRQP
ncbi:MAG: GntR family transcriptional regulator [Kiritimatiellae bacterium]|nr:GntR family transcriptional regulator [Kiritimatiellia bacterium]